MKYWNLLIIACTGLLFFCVDVATAQVLQNRWTGGGGNRNWETPGNWGLGVLPAPNHDVVIPADSGQIRITTDTIKDVNSFRMVASPGAANRTFLTSTLDPANQAALRIRIVARNGDISIESGNTVQPIKSGVVAGLGRPGADVSLEAIGPVGAGGSVTIAAGANVIGGQGGGNAPDQRPAKGGDVLINALHATTILGMVRGGDSGGSLAAPIIGGAMGGDVTVGSVLAAVINRGQIIGGLGHRGRGGDILIVAQDIDNDSPGAGRRAVIRGGQAGGTGERGGHVTLRAWRDISNLGVGGALNTQAEIMGGRGAAAGGGNNPGSGGTVRIRADRDFLNGTFNRGHVSGGQAGASGPPFVHHGGPVIVRADNIATVGALITGGAGAGQEGPTIYGPAIVVARRIDMLPTNKLRGWRIQLGALMPFLPLSGGDEQDDMPLIDLRGAGASAIEADESVCISIEGDGILDLRDNPAGAAVITVNDPDGWINIIVNEENVLTDPGVFLSDLTDPPTEPSPFAEPCELDVSCPADFDGDGQVDGFDLLILLAQWGHCEEPDDCPADLNGDGMVDGQDILLLLEAWGPCP